MPDTTAPATVPATTPGWKTSEFWLHLGSMALSGASVVLPIVLGVSNPYTMIVGAVAGLASAWSYSKGRVNMKTAALAVTQAAVSSQTTGEHLVPAITAAMNAAAAALKAAANANSPSNAPSPGSPAPGSAV